MRICLPAALFLFGVLGCAQLTPVTPPSESAPVTLPTKARQEAIDADKALALLQAGNARFLAKKPAADNISERISTTATAQYPFASILSCIDSRVPPEVIFDAGIGDIFVARVAGNIVDDDVLGSLEYASKVAGSRLIVVLGHTQCGAVKGAIDDVHLGHLTGLLGKIHPAVAFVSREEGKRTSKDSAYVEAVTRENVKLAVSELSARSPILNDMLRQKQIRIVGALYDVGTGQITFLE